MAFYTMTLSAQEFVEVSYNPSYSTHSFYNLKDDSEVTYLNEEWDIAFSALGMTDAGVHINEAITSSGEELELYLSLSNNWDDKIDPVDLTIRLYNEDIDWANGAFNSIKDPSNPFDYGWGEYKPASHEVVGEELFVLKLRNGLFVKMMITSFVNNTYNIRWASLDGSNEQTASINRGDYPDSDLILFSLEEGKTLSGVKPFDLLFTRYSTRLPDGQGDTLDYTVTGVLSGNGIEVAEAKGIDPETVVFDDFKDQLDSRLDVIGQDWKEFNLTTFMWRIFDDVAYFVKDQENTIWKLIFIDFEGSSSGNVVFTKENLGKLTKVNDLSEINGLHLYPNPVVDKTNLVLDLESPFTGVLSIVALDGKIADQRKLNLDRGLINLEIDVDHLIPGEYRLVLSNESGNAEKAFVKK